MSQPGMLQSKAASLHRSDLQSPHVQGLQSLTGEFELTSNVEARISVHLQL